MPDQTKVSSDSDQKQEQEESAKDFAEQTPEVKIGCEENIGYIDVLSCGIGFPKDEESLRLLREADVVYGSYSLLAQCPEISGEQRPLTVRAEQDSKDALALCRNGNKIVFLASGDSLYHGIGSTLARLRKKEQITWHPNITAFQVLFAKLGIPWEEARLFSVHKGEISTKLIAEAPLSVTYGGSRYPANAVAKAILKNYPASADRAALIVERLGSQGEEMYSGSLKDMAEVENCSSISMLLLFPDATMSPLPSSSSAAPELMLGRDNEEYRHEKNLITAPEVRAIALSWLRLPAWGVLWDIGAGSGVVGLEAVALRPDLQVHAFERHPERCVDIEKNRERFGIINYHLHIGDALENIRIPAPILPDPDRVFVGGGGKMLPDLLDACLERLKPSGRIVASAVTLESLALLLNWQSGQRIDFCRIEIAKERPIAGEHKYLAPQHTLYLFAFAKKKCAFENNFFPQV